LDPEKLIFLARTEILTFAYTAKLKFLTVWPVTEVTRHLSSSLLTLGPKNKGISNFMKIGAMAN